MQKKKKWKIQHLGAHNKEFLKQSRKKQKEGQHSDSGGCHHHLLLLLLLLLLDLHLHIDSCGEIERHEAVYGLGGHVLQVYEALVRPDLELLARVLVDVRGLENGVLSPSCRQVSWPGLVAARPVSDVEDGLDGFLRSDEEKENEKSEEV